MENEKKVILSMDEYNELDKLRNYKQQGDLIRAYYMPSFLGTVDSRGFFITKDEAISRMDVDNCVLKNHIEKLNKEIEMLKQDRNIPDFWSIFFGKSQK